MTTIPTFRQTGAGNLFIINSDYKYGEEKLLRQMRKLLTTRTSIFLCTTDATVHTVPCYRRGKMMDVY